MGDFMKEFIYRTVLYLACFCVSFWALMGLDFERFIRKGRTKQAQMILLLVSMALAYLVAQFLMGLLYRNIFM